MKVYILITLSRQEGIEAIQKIADKIRLIPSGRSITAMDRYYHRSLIALPKIMVVMEFEHYQLDEDEERKHVTNAVDTEIKPISGIKSVNVEFALPMFSYR